MKKSILFLIALFALCGVWANVLADPFLICDPPPSEQEITHYEIFKNGVFVAATNGVEADGSLRYDVVGHEGSNEWTAKACNVWGCSVLSDPYVSPHLAGKPSGVGLAP